MPTSPSAPSPSPSPSWRERALAAFPAGSNGEYQIPPELVPVLERGLGPLVWDTEGTEWLDVTMAWGSALVGHAHPAVLEAATRVARDGFNFAAVNRQAVELAERVKSLSPCAERVRLVASGTEATMLCLRVAHAATGRSKVLRFLGAYHGQHPVGVAGMLAGDRRQAPQCDAAGAGAPWAERDVLVAPFNDITTTVETISAHASELAAIIVEPFHRCLRPLPGFLPGLRDAATRHGVPLIFDEVVTGFRFAPGGAQQYYGVTPDLVAYGKALGGGFPIGAYAGRADLMDVVSEHRLPGPRYAWSASTTGGNPISCAAALATLDLLCPPGVHARLHQRGEELRAGMKAVLDRHAPDGQVLGDGPIAQFAFAPQPIIDHDTWSAADRRRGRAVMLELLRQRVFLNPLGTKLYLSIAHENEHLSRFLERFDDALRIALRNP